MSLSRREALLAGGVAGAGLALSGCSSLVNSRLAPALPDEIRPPAQPEPARRLADRLGFGPRPGDLAHIVSMGSTAYVEEQLKADQPLPPNLVALLHRLDVLRMDGMELRDLPEDEIVRQLQQAAILRAVYNPNQLHERLVDFWTNHFNIYARKGLAAYRKARDEQEVSRRHALGRFEDLVLASATSPAMLAYLDNRVNLRGVPNENYARELLELHTMGVDGGYTQRDIVEVARCFTGWTVEARFLRPQGRFRFNPALHDDGEKIVLGHRIPAGGGEEDGRRVIEILSKHPSTARYIAKKLTVAFWGEADPKWIQKLERAFTASGGDIRATLRPLLTSPELFEAPAIAKRPFDFLVSALRATAANTDGDAPLQAHLERMGQPLYQWPMPDGYPVKTEAWTGSLLARWNFAMALCNGAIPRTRVDIRELDARSSVGGYALAAEQVLGHSTRSSAGRRMAERLGQAAREGGLTESGATAFALALAAPEFQWR